MTIVDECRYCYREVDASGLEGFRCTNESINKSTSWCRFKNANKPCSTCEFCEVKDNKECLFYETCSSRTAVCKVRQPDIGCPVYRYFKDLIVKDYEARLKADMVAMLTDIQLELKGYKKIEGCSDFERFYNKGIQRSYITLQQKINALREEEEENHVD